jgi:predicted MFS family arabinose efflux permease
MVLSLAGVFGIINAFDMPARQSFVVELVGKEDLGNAIALNSAAFNIARIVGPAVAGVLLATVGEGSCFWLNALSYVAVLASLARLDLPKREFFQRGRALGSSLKEGVRYAWTTLPLRNLLLLLGVTAGIGFQYLLLLPVYARDILHAGPKAYGLLVTAFGAGALFGAVCLTGRSARSGLRRNLLLGLAACGSGLALFAWSRSIPLSLCAGALTGFGLIVYVASTNTLLQLTTEDRFRGRVMSLYTLMFAGTTPIGALGSGAIAQRWGAPVSTTVSAVVMLIGAALVAWRFTVLARLQSDRVAEPATTERLG